MAHTFPGRTRHSGSLTPRVRYDRHTLPSLQPDEKNRRARKLPRHHNAESLPGLHGWTPPVQRRREKGP